MSWIALLTPVGAFNPCAGFFTLKQFTVLKIKLFLHKFDLHYCLLKDSWLRKWGWHDHLAEKFATALPNLKQLVHFSFRYDCTKSILEVLSQTCKGTLRILDIERSRHIEDDSVDLIKTCNKLMKINFFLTGFSTKAMVIIPPTWFLSIKCRQRLQTQIVCFEKENSTM